MRQSEIVLKHIEEYGHITSWEAMQEYGIKQLHPVIADLIRAGIPIKREMVSQKNRYGDTVTFARYSLVEKEGV